VDSGASPSQVDPFKWKNAAPMAFTAFTVVMLSFVEYALWRDHLPRDRPRAIIFGVVLLISVVGLIRGCFNWLRRPLGEDALKVAAERLAELLPESPLVSHEPKKPRSGKLVAVVLPLGVLAVAAFEIALDHWVVGSCLVGVALLAGGLVWYFVVLRRSEPLLRVITVDVERKVVTFDNFKFATSFWPAQPTPREEIPFAQILDATYTPAQKGDPGTLALKTTRGPTSLTARFERFPEVRTALESAVTLNYADPLQRQANLRAIPQVRVPAAGWLIAVVALGGTGALIWWFISRIR
jgi:hypothetical protein